MSYSETCWLLGGTWFQCRYGGFWMSSCQLMFPGVSSEKAMAPHSSTFAWKIPWMEPGRLQSMGSLELDTTERLHFHFSLSCIGEGNGNPLQCSCLENPRGGEAWWAAVYGVAQNQTRLKQLSSSSSSISSSRSQFSGVSCSETCWLLGGAWFQCRHGGFWMSSC